jgi:hypothetical protein
VLASESGQSNRGRTNERVANQHDCDANVARQLKAAKSIDGSLVQKTAARSAKSRRTRCLGKHCGAENTAGGPPALNVAGEDTASARICRQLLQGRRGQWLSANGCQDVVSTRSSNLSMWDCDVTVVSVDTPTSVLPKFF